MYFLARWPCSYIQPTVGLSAFDQGITKSFTSNDDIKAKTNIADTTAKPVLCLVFITTMSLQVTKLSALEHIVHGSSFSYSNTQQEHHFQTRPNPSTTTTLVNDIRNNLILWQSRARTQIGQSL